MNLMKWMTVTALATATVFGSFVGSAEARGGKWSGENINEPETFFEFSLFTQTPEGEDILDSVPTRRIERCTGIFRSGFGVIRQPERCFLGNDVGLFKEAIRDFSFCSQSDLPDKFPELGFGCESSNFKGSYTGDSFHVLDLQARDREGVVEYSFLLPHTDQEVFPTNQFFGFDFELPLDMIPQELDPVNSIEDIFTLFNLRNDDGKLLIQRLKKISSVPESSSRNTLLAIGILGVGIGVKRKLK